MAYTNNVPQGTQRIADTQPLIQANFGFIQTDIQREHIFNGNTGPVGATQQEGTHIQTSMPNQTVTPTLGTGIDGVYFVRGGKPCYVNASGATILQTAPITSNVLSGTFTAVTPSVLYNVVTLPANSVGSFYIVQLGSTTNYSFGQFVTVTANISAAALSNNKVFIATATALTLQASVSVGATGTYNYVVVYYTP